MAPATPPPPPPPSLVGGTSAAAAGAAAHRGPTDDDIQRILSSQPRSLESQSPFQGFSITAVIGYVAGAAMVVTGLSSQNRTADQHSAQAINVAGGFTLICLASICRHTKRLSGRQDS